MESSFSGQSSWDRINCPCRAQSPHDTRAQLWPHLKQGAGATAKKVGKSRGPEASVVETQGKEEDRWANQIGLAWLLGRQELPRMPPHVPTGL